MRTRRFLKLILPPILVDTIKYLTGESTFQGIYHRREDIESTQDDYSAEILVDEAFKEASTRIQALYNKGKLPIPTARSQYSSLLPFLISIVQNKEVLYVLDFGGGFGNGFLDCFNNLNQSFNKIQYHIVELPEVVGKARFLFKNFKNIHFHEEIPQNTRFDIVNIGSCLQYMKDYKAVLSELCGIRPSFILITDHYIGNCESYYTIQSNLKGLRIPYLIINYDEIVSYMEQYSYKLIFSSANLQEHTYKKVDSDHIVKNSLNLLFKLKNVENYNKGRQNE